MLAKHFEARVNTGAGRGNLGDGEEMKVWTDTEQSWDSAPVVLYPTAQASAATWS